MNTNPANSTATVAHGPTAIVAAAGTATGATGAVGAAAAGGASQGHTAGVKKPKNPKKYICGYCDRAFSRSEHKSRMKERILKNDHFIVQMYLSKFVRRDLLQRHDRTVHAAKKENANNMNNGNNNSTTPSANTNINAANTSTISTQNSGTNAGYSPATLANAAAPITSSFKKDKPEDVDVDFNAAVLMTELQHSFHKQADSKIPSNILPYQSDFNNSVRTQQQLCPRKFLLTNLSFTPPTPPTPPTTTTTTTTTTIIIIIIIIVIITIIIITPTFFIEVKVQIMFPNLIHRQISITC